MEFFNNLIEWSHGITEKLIQVLPLSPFASYISDLQNSDFAGYMHYVNYFVPFYAIVPIFGAWIVAYTSYLFYSVIMRWVKLISD